MGLVAIALTNLLLGGGSWMLPVLYAAVVIPLLLVVYLDIRRGG